MATMMTVFLSLLIVALLFALFFWVKTPFYRVDKARMVQVLEMVLTGQATENDWRIVFDITIRHDSNLEAFRQQALEIEEKHFIGLSASSARSDYLFSQQGLVELETLLQNVKEL